MRTHSSEMYTTLSSNELKTLTMEVKETLAGKGVSNAKRSFCPADLWKIQRNSRTASVRRHILLN